MARAYIDYQTAYNMDIRKQKLLFGRKFEPREVAPDPEMVAAAAAAEAGEGIAAKGTPAGRKHDRPNTRKRPKR